MWSNDGKSMSGGLEAEAFGAEQLGMLAFDYAGTMERLMEQKLREAKNRLEYYALRIAHGSPENQIREKRLHLVEKEEALEKHMERALLLAKQRLALLAERLEGVSPLKKLKQGYAYVATENGKRITNASMVKQSEVIQVYFSDGFLNARVEEKKLTDGEI